MTDPIEHPECCFGVELDGGTSVYAEHEQLLTADDPIPIVTIRLPASRAHALAHLMHDWVSVFRVAPDRGDRPSTALLGRSIEDAVAALGETGAMACASRAAGAVPSRQTARRSRRAPRRRPLPVPGRADRGRRRGCPLARRGQRRRAGLRASPCRVLVRGRRNPGVRRAARGSASNWGGTMTATPHWQRELSDFVSVTVEGQIRSLDPDVTTHERPAEW